MPIALPASGGLNIGNYDALDEAKMDAVLAGAIS